jgi:hypothetical protein
MVIMAADDNTQIFNSQTGMLNGSQAFGISIRGWIAIFVVFAVCFNQLLVTTTVCYFALFVKQDIGMLGSQTPIVEPLYSLCTMAVGFYFGKQTSK